MATPNWNLVPVRGQFVGSDGLPMSGRLLFTPRVSRFIDAEARRIIIGRATAVLLDGDGKVEVNLPATDDPDITPNGFTWQVTEDFVGGSTYEIEVPLAAAESGIELSNVAPVPPNVGIGPSVVTRLEYEELRLAVIGHEAGHENFALASDLDSLSGDVADLTETVGDLTSLADPLAIWRARLSMRHRAPAVVVVVGGSTWYGSTTSNPSMKVTERLLYRLQSAYPSGILGYEGSHRNVGNGYPDRDTLPGVQMYVSAAGGLNSTNYINSTNRPLIQWHRPGLVIHGVGANDALDNPTYHVDVEDYIANVGAAIDSIDAGLTTYGPASHVLVHQFRRPGVSKGTWAEYGAALHEVAKTRPNVIVVDLSEPFEHVDLAGSDPLDLLDVDGSHLNDAGHEMLADLLGEALGIPKPTNDWKLILSDSFRRGSPTGMGEADYPANRPWEPQGSAVGMVFSGTLILTTAGTALIECGASDLEYDGVIQLHETDTSLPGLVFRATNDNNRMGFFLNRASGVVSLYKTVAGTTTLITSATKALSAGGRYHVKVRAVGDRVWCYLNGEKLIDYTMTSAEYTSLGYSTKVGVRDNTSGLAAFSSLRVRLP